MTNGRPSGPGEESGTMQIDVRTLPTLFDVARARAELSGDRLLCTFLVDGDKTEERLTYAELDLRARRAAALLQAHGGHGERALLLYEPGIAYLVGYYACIYAGWIPVPAYPPNPLRLARTLPRLQAILGEVRPRLILTTSAIAAVAEQMMEMLEEARGIPIAATDAVELGLEKTWHPPALSGEDIAVLQYTSGSVGSPKGVRVSHRALLHNLGLCAAVPATGEDTRIVCWLPPYHDMGLVGGVLWPLFVGGQSVNLSPLHFLSRPLRWLRAITRYRCNNMVGPNFAYQLCVRKVTPAERDRLELSSVVVAWNGAEPIRPEVLRQFTEYFSPCGFRETAFYPCYGLAESTLLVAGGNRDEAPRVRGFSAAGLSQGVARPAGSGEEAQQLVSCGRARPGMELRIVDAETARPLEEGRIGEIWLRSPSLGSGYFARPEVTAETFEARTADGDGPWLRTGDLGFVVGGELFIAGRLKDLIIIRGRNLYPHDIELTAERAVKGLRPGCTAAFPVDVNGEESLALVAEVDARLAAPEAAAELAAVHRPIVEAVVAAFDVSPESIALIEPGSIPKTPSGKLQRRLCRQMLAEGTLVPLSTWRRGTPLQ
jgi:acyl-CoA synthetase (AMP-forming)/AMP-acid ligase II